MASQDEEEQLGLLHYNKVEGSDGSPDSGEHWANKTLPKRNIPYVRTTAIALLIAVIVGVIVHSLLLPRIKSTTLTPLAQLRPEEDYILGPKWNFDAEPTIREYSWTISEHDLNPDGVYRRMILINGMFPGPLIECNEGDEIIIHVRNGATNATSIHWHGLFQNGSNWMDGAVGITQCPIAPGHNFTYRFRVNGQSGTYYYHSHVGVQHADGLVGPLVIHGRKEKKLQKTPYGQDRVVLVSDHYWNLSSELLVQYLEPGNENDEPVPPSAVINGRNVRNCTALPNRNCSNSDRANALFDLSSHNNTRLRFINVGAFAEFSIQIDEHEVHVTEVDGTDVLPQSIHRLNINPGQRYSAILVPSNNLTRNLYWLRARMITHCFPYSPIDNPELQEEVRGIIRYPDSQLTSTPDPSSEPLTPSSKDWPEIIDVECLDLNTSLLVPALPIRAPDHVDDTIYLESTFQIHDWKLSRGYLNHSSYRPNITHPTLHRIFSSPSTSSTKSNSSSLPSSPGPRFGLFNPTLPGTPHGLNSQPSLIYQTHGPKPRVLDILIHNLDDGNHPFHLHGYKFWVLGQGQGPPPPNPILYSSSYLDLDNPLRRDTASVEAYGWLLMRFVADNPGVWAFHCHISWHAEAGLVMEFAVGVEQMREWEVPVEVGELCGVEGIERGGGPRDGEWMGRSKGP